MGHKPRLLDLFCGAGGATKGYQLAGFYVVGVDIKPQPHYCGDEFYQADALEFPLEGYDAYHASPPCGRFSRLTPPQYRKYHRDYIAHIRARLQFQWEMRQAPYVIENVTDAKYKLIEPFMLCGTMFGLPTRRHRYFETQPRHDALLITCQHDKLPVVVSGTTRRKTGRIEYPADECYKAMDIDWMIRTELDKAIPPAYTEYIGKYLMEYLDDNYG